MKKGVILFACILIIAVVAAQSSDFIPLAFQSYPCSDGTTSVYNIKSIDVGKSNNINGLWLGLAYSRTSAILFFTNSNSFTLTNSSPQQQGWLANNSSYNVTLLSLADQRAVIRITPPNIMKAENKTIIQGETDGIAGYRVFVLSAQGAYPGNPTVKVMVGEKELPMTNEDVKNITSNKTDFILELYSSTSEKAYIKVDRCDNESVRLNVTAVNSTELNGTILNATLNETEQVNNSSGDTSDAQTNPKSYFWTVMFIASGIFAIIFLFLFFRYLQDRRHEKKLAEPPSTPVESKEIE
jgi:hypothetical protein